MSKGMFFFLIVAQYVYILMSSIFTAYMYIYAWNFCMSFFCVL